MLSLLCVYAARTMCQVLALAKYGQVEVGVGPQTVVPATGVGVLTPVVRRSIALWV